MSELTSYEQMAIWAVLGISLLGLAYAYLLRNQILREDKGTAKMQEIWGWIKDGANAYLSRQLRSILPFIVVLTIAPLLRLHPPRHPLPRPPPGELYIGLWRAFAFIMGATFSLTVGQIGMRMAVEGNVRTAAAARTSFSDALRIAYRSGTITGMLTDGLGLLGGTLIFIFFGKPPPMPCSASASAARCWRCSCAWAAASSPRRPMWAPTWWARSSRTCPKTTRATPP